MENESIKKGTVVTIVIVILLIVIGTYAYVNYGKKPVVETPNVGIVDASSQVRITAKHQFKDGKHIIAGQVDLPTPCYILNAAPVIKESSPEQVTINFTATTQGEVCAQVVTTERFKTEFTASSDATIDATWNGKPVILNLIPAGANEDLNNFEVFIKG